MAQKKLKKSNTNYSQYTIEFNERLQKEEESLKVQPSEVTRSKRRIVINFALEVPSHSDEEDNKPTQLKYKELQQREHFKEKAKLYKMCSEQEIKERQSKNQINIFEQDPRTNGNESLPKWMIKSSSVDTIESSTPDNIRSPDVLLKTTKYIVKRILDANFYVNIPFKYPKDSNNKSRAHTFGDVYQFSSDRFKAIIQDIIILDEVTEETIYILEIISRFYAICFYECQSMETDYDLAILRQDFDSCLKQLIKMYELFERVQEYKYSEYQYEIYRYNILLHSQDESYLNQFLASIPNIKHEKIQSALKIVNDFQTSNYQSFFLIAKDLSYLDCCVIFPFFGEMRTKTINIMKQQDIQVTVEELQNILFFESVPQTLAYLKSEGCNTAKLTVPVEYETDNEEEKEDNESSKNSLPNQDEQLNSTENKNESLKMKEEESNNSCNEKVETEDLKTKQVEDSQDLPKEEEKKEKKLKVKKVTIDWNNWSSKKTKFIELNSKISEKKTLIHYPQYKQSKATNNDGIVTRAYLVTGPKYVNCGREEVNS